MKDKMYTLLMDLKRKYYRWIVSNSTPLIWVVILNIN